MVELIESKISEKEMTLLREFMLSHPYAKIADKIRLPELRANSLKTLLIYVSSIGINLALSNISLRAYILDFPCALSVSKVSFLASGRPSCFRAFCFRFSMTSVNPEFHRLLKAPR